MAEFLPYRAHNMPHVGAQPSPLGVYWEDLRFPATATRRGQSDFPALSLDPVGRVFRNDEKDSVYMIAQLPHSWRPGSELRPHVHWCKQTTGDMTGEVLWELHYRWSSIGKVIANAVEITASEPTISDGDTANQHALTQLPAISGKGRKISDMLLMKLTRIGDDSDDSFGGNVLMLEFDIHYQISSPGSRQELKK